MRIGSWPKRSRYFANLHLRRRWPGILKTGLPGDLGPGATVVCVLTGHGLKDPDIAISQISVPTVIDADLGAVLDELAL